MELISTDETGKILDLTPEELRKAVADDMLREYRLGKRVMYRLDEVLSLKEAFRVPRN
jgi:hypothetical protein